MIISEMGKGNLVIACTFKEKVFLKSHSNLIVFNIIVSLFFLLTLLASFRDTSTTVLFLTC